MYFLIFFLISLQSYYFYNIGASIFTYIGTFIFLIYFFTSKKNYFFKKNTIINFLIFIIVFSFVFIIYPDDFKSIAGIFLCFIFYYLLKIEINNENLNKIYKSLNLVIILHIIAWFLQFFYWFGFGTYLDLLEPITGETQRYLSAKGMILFGLRVPRFTGLFNEPGTYSTVIFVLLACMVLIKKRFSYSILLSILTMLASMSLYGFIFSIAITCYLLLNKKNYKYFIYSSIFIIPIIIFIYDFIDERINSDYSGIDNRELAYQTILQEFNNSPTGLVLGRSFEQINNTYLDFALNDLSLFVSLIYSYGLFGALCIIYFFIVPIFSNKKSISIIILLILSSKIKFTYPIVWIFLALLSSQKNKTNSIHISSLEKNKLLNK